MPESTLPSTEPDLAREEESLAQTLVIDFALMPTVYVSVFGIGLTSSVFVLLFFSDSWSEASLFLFTSLIAVPLNLMVVWMLRDSWRVPRSKQVHRRMIGTVVYVLSVCATPASMVMGDESVFVFLYRLVRFLAGGG